MFVFLPIWWASGLVAMSILGKESGVHLSFIIKQHMQYLIQKFITHHPINMKYGIISKQNLITLEKQVICFRREKHSEIPTEMVWLLY